MTDEGEELMPVMGRGLVKDVTSRVERAAATMLGMYGISPHG